MSEGYEQELRKLERPSYYSNSLVHQAFVGEQSERTAYRNAKNDILLEEVARIIQKKRSGKLKEDKSMSELQ